MLARLLLTVARRAIPCGSVEITRRVVTRFGLPVTQVGLSVSHIRSQIAVTSLYIALARGCEGVSIYLRDTVVLILPSQCRGPS